MRFNLQTDNAHDCMSLPCNYQRLGWIEPVVPSELSKENLLSKIDCSGTVQRYHWNRYQSGVNNSFYTMIVFILKLQKITDYCHSLQDSAVIRTHLFDEDHLMFTPFTYFKHGQLFVRRETTMYLESFQANHTHAQLVSY